MKEDGKVFALRLTEARTEKGIKQKDAAEALGLSQALLSHYENGIRECGLDFLGRAADYYGVSVDYLLGLTDAKEAVLDLGDEVGERLDEKGKRMTGSVLPTLCRKQILSGVNLLYYMLEKIGSNELTSAVSDDILLAVYNGFRTAYLTNPENEESFFGVRDGYFAALVRRRDEHLGEIIRAAAKADGKGVTEDDIEKEFGASLSAVNNMMKNCEADLRRKKG